MYAIHCHSRACNIFSENVVRSDFLPSHQKIALVKQDPHESCIIDSILVLNKPVTILHR